jgi:hypothetical protein
MRFGLIACQKKILSMYLQEQENTRLGLPFLPLVAHHIPLRTSFASKAIMYKDQDAADQIRPTKCSIYVPGALKSQRVIDLMVFFHGYDRCAKHNFDPELVIKNFGLDVQVERAPRKVALAVPSIFWSYTEHPGSDVKNIQAAWSAAYLNDFVEEVCDQISKASGIKQMLGRLILAGHSGAYAILTPLADQFHMSVRATKERALAKLDTVLAFDTTYSSQHAKALDLWARTLAGRANFALVLNNGSHLAPPNGWKAWKKVLDKARMAVPANLKVYAKTGTSDTHCGIVQHIGSLLL